MKTTWDELMRYAPEKEYPLPALERGEQERIRNKTMKKLEKTKKRPARPVRTALLAAAIAALLCGENLLLAGSKAPLTQTAGSASTGCSERRPR